MDINNIRIAVIGLGYVGLPLMVEFAKKYPTLGFDINSERISQLRDGIDSMKDLSKNELKESVHGSFSVDPADLKDYNVYIITVPTPVDKNNRPDLTALENTCQLVGKVLSKNDIVIYESTVFPGATEEVCVPILEEFSGFKLNESFYVGYSPERINPGDKKHRLSSVIKVTAGSNKEAAGFVDTLYQSIIKAGTHPASSIKVAEASKVIENTQRDLNIALVNELSIIFHRLGIDTEEVLEAAGTKWNFLPFRPGLVGGHCIGVDPYYLTYKSQEIGYHPEVILAGRRINDEMGKYISERVVKEITRKRIHVVDANILIMGLTFKEDCPDIRNTRVVEMAKGLEEYQANVDIYDPWVEPKNAEQEYGLEILSNPEPKQYDTVIIAVAHECFKEMGVQKIRGLCEKNHVIFDVKYLFPLTENLERL